MALLVVALTIGMNYDCYANAPAASVKKTGVFSRLGKEVVVLVLGVSLSTNLFQLWSNQRMTNRYEKLVGETKVLWDDYHNLVSVLKGLDEGGQVSDIGAEYSRGGHIPDIRPEYSRGLAGDNNDNIVYLDSGEGIPIRSSVISFDDMLTPILEIETLADIIDIEYVKEIRQAGIAFHSVDAYNNIKDSLPADFYVGLTIFFRLDGVTGVGVVQSIANNGSEQLLIISNNKEEEILAIQSEIESVFVTRHPLYTHKKIDVEFPAASMESYNNKGLPQNYQQTYRRPDNQSDRLDIIRKGSLQGKLIMPSTGDKSVVKIVFPSGEEFFVLVPARDLTPL